METYTIFLIIGIIAFLGSFCIKSIKAKLILALAFAAFCSALFVITLYIIGGYSGIVAVMAAQICTAIIAGILLNTLCAIIYKKVNRR